MIKFFFERIMRSIPLIVQTIVLLFLIVSVIYNLYKKLYKKEKIPKYLILKELICCLIVFLGPWIVSIIINSFTSGIMDGEAFVANWELIGDIIIIIISMLPIIYFSKKKLFIIIPLILIIVVYYLYWSNVLSNYPFYY